MNIIFENLKRLSEAFRQVANAKFVEDKLNIQIESLKKKVTAISIENVAK
jgi:hypothetical protein